MNCCGSKWTKPSSALCKQRKLDQLEAVTATADETAIVLGVSRGLVFAGIKNGKILSVVVNSRILIPIASLARMFVEADWCALALCEDRHIGQRGASRSHRAVVGPGKSEPTLVRAVRRTEERVPRSQSLTGDGEMR
jgi:hypothetical protein